MKAVWGMLGAGIGCSLCAYAALGAPAGLAVLLGAAAPLAAAAGTRLAVDSASRKNPAVMTQVLIVGFAGKMVFFGAYVAVVLEVVSVRPLPFVVSFTAFFLVCHVVEALHLRRLSAGNGSA